MLILNTITTTTIAIVAEDGRQHQWAAYQWLGLQAQRANVLFQHWSSLRRTVATATAAATTIAIVTNTHININTITFTIAIAVEDGRQHQWSAHEWLGRQAQPSNVLSQHWSSSRRTVVIVTAAATTIAIVTTTDTNS